MIKSKHEIDDLKLAGNVNQKVWKFVVDKIEQVINDEENISHAKISESATKLFDDEWWLSKFADDKKNPMDKNLIEVGGNIVIQSGQNVDFKLSAKSDGNQLESNTIFITIPCKYKDLCVIQSWTLIIDSDDK